MLTVYHNESCSKSQGVCSLLKEKGVQAEIVEYLKTSPGAKELRDLLRMLRMQPSELIRRNEPLFQELFAEKMPTENDYLEAMLQYPILIERPIIVKDGEAIIGRPPEKVLHFLGTDSRPE